MRASLSSYLLRVLALVALLVPTMSWAVDADALLQALIKKGVISEKDAAEIEAQSQKEEANKSANKIKLSDSIQELRLYGDVRMRYQYDSKDPQVAPATGGGSPSGAQRSAFRLRLRLNADFKLSDNWFGGVELQTGYASDTGNQVLQDGFSDYPIFVSRAFFGYAPTDWLTLTIGKVPNPFYTTELMWDSDINPAGLTEKISLSKLFGRPSEEGGLSKDGKTIAKASTPKWDFTIVAGQLIFDDNNEGGGRDPGGRDHDSNTDAWLFETQLIISYRFSEKTKLTIAPTWMVYNAASFSLPSAVTATYGDPNTNPFVDTADVSGATRNLNIINVPGDLSFQVGRVKTRFFWDFAYNFEGEKRAEETYQLSRVRDDGTRGGDHRTKDDFAYLLGLQLGENKRKGDLSFVATWRQVGIASIDPNLNDSDYALSELNIRGPRFALNYNLSDFAVLTLNYGYAWNLRKNLVGGQATTDNAIADANVVHLFQVDLNVKF